MAYRFFNTDFDGARNRIGSPFPLYNGDLLLFRVENMIGIYA